MPHEPSAYDKERIAHINFLMDVINDSASEIYESLVDRDFETLKPLPHLKSGEQLKLMKQGILDYFGEIY